MKAFRITVEMDPADLAVNAAFRAGRDRRGRTRVRKSDRYADARSKLGEAAMLAALDMHLETLTVPVRVSIKFFWDGRELDVDAPVKGTLDALQDAGIFADDAQVIRLTVSKGHDPDRPRIEVSVRAMSN